ncbi:GCN5 family acetyltransferase [Methylobacterium oryzihabitans]|uniref:GCN5 family acetyltransferase n=1 Tax=Methylobacterium oryzihabitans TaxID=2499852 RepID=A0A437P478_9HYPH|nr:GCN5 family acetyltransferase [Methylobacterium oryzihabitans]
MAAPIDAEAAGFWRRRGFLPSRDDDRGLFRALADIAASLG